MLRPWLSTWLSSSPAGVGSIVLVASIETLIGQVADKTLRERLAREVAELKRRLSWGLVFERHLPENTRLLAAPIKVGTAVWERRAAKPRRLVVRAIEDGELVVAAEAPNTTAAADAPTELIARDNVLVEHDFAKPIFPVLTPIDTVRRGPADRPAHAVIEGENYHALETLLVAFEHLVDVIYLDPPYNTGNRDWSYNNDYVDPNDTYRPSKWLAFMERRLRLARRLLKPDGVLVVTIDEHEVHHLGMLLEQLFPEAYRQVVTIVINPKGVTQGRFSRVEEHAMFCFFGTAVVTGRGDDLLTPQTDDEADNGGRAPRWKGLLRSGESASRADRKQMFYPVLIDAARGAVVTVGDPLPFDQEPTLDAKLDGYDAAWPIKKDGTYGRWSVGTTTLRRLIAQGYVAVGGFDKKRRTWAISYLSRQAQEQVAAGVLEVVGNDETRNVIDVRYSNVAKRQIKTVWHRTAHDAGAGGSDLLGAFIGTNRAFPFPKSLYAVRDTLAALTRERPSALILDFFAGSGTTLHATMLLNREDGGSRRCILVTNNEVRAETATRLNKAGHFRGDPEFEAAGVFEAACRPRVAAAVTGLRPDGQSVEGAYLDGHDYAEGFAESVEFFRLDYLDPVEVEMGLRFAELHPLLWLRAGGVGQREAIDPKSRHALPAGSPYGMLFDPSGMPDLLAGLATRPDVAQVFIVADSETTFADLASALPAGVEPVRLYRAYLETLRGATV
jgi:adenine-specific DNA-methyltransferase